jgi:hypothetical protein
VGNAQVVFSLVDSGGRRFGMERRRFSYDGYIPERRSGEDRRQMADRRSVSGDRRSGLDRRDSLPNEGILLDFQAYRERRALSDRRSGIDRREFMFV